MLKENIKTLRKQKGLSQEELSVKLNVVRQTISKWEQGLSVPDAEMLIALSEVFDTPVSMLLGENMTETNPNNIKTISEKLEIINLQLAQKNENRRKFWHWFFITECFIMIVIFIVLIALGNSYMEWNYSEPELAVLGVQVHSFIWLYARIAPILFTGSIVGICLTKKRR